MLCSCCDFSFFFLVHPLFLANDDIQEEKSNNLRAAVMILYNEDITENTGIAVVSCGHIYCD